MLRLTRLTNILLRLQSKQVVTGEKFEESDFTLEGVF